MAQNRIQDSVKYAALIISLFQKLVLKNTLNS